MDRFASTMLAMVACEMIGFLGMFDCLSGLADLDATQWSLVGHMLALLAFAASQALVIFRNVRSAR